MNNPAWTVRALSVPGDDTDLTLWVSFDNARFCFGAGEGTQRAFVQKRLTMRGIQAIFIPDGVSGRAGLPGMIMTAADAGAKDLTIIGPPDTNMMLASTRGSVVRDQFLVEGRPFPRDSTAPSELLYDSQRLKVYGVALRPEERLVSLQDSEHHPRPTTLLPSDADKYAAAIVRDTFGRGLKIERPELDAPPIFPGMNRYASPDDRYPLPLPSDADVATDMVYILRTPDVRGKFDNARAKELNIPNGPIRAQLTRGEVIEYDDPTAPGGRRVVKPEECLVGGGLGSILILVNCREHNLDRLLASTAFDVHQQQDGADAELHVHAVVHRVPRTVWEDERYQAWMAKFGPTTEHMLADKLSTHEIFFAGSAWNATKLNMINPDIFRVPYNVLEAPPPPTLAANADVLQVNHLLKMHPAKPKEMLANHDKDVVFPTTEEALNSARTELARGSPEFITAVQEAWKSVARAEVTRIQAPAPGDDIVITTLGTGSAIPSKYRNVSSTHVDIPNVGGVLLDCGEGTLGQLRRRFGPEGVKKVLADLRMIYVSHMHADHHLGLCSILADRFKLGITSPLYLVAPSAIAVQMEETAWWQHDVSTEALENIKWVNCHRLRRPWRPRVEERTPDSSAPGSPTKEEKLENDASRENAFAEDVAAGKRKWPFRNVFRYSDGNEAGFYDSIFGLLNDLGLSSIHTPAVAHRGAAYGLVLRHNSGWSLAYSGDTKPCEPFNEAAREVTILIHEATIEDDKPEVAEAKGHSTFGQAIEAGRKMNAKYVILNHFSQRYPKAPNLTLSSGGPDVAVSFDFMSLRAGDTWKMAHYMDAISILFKEVEEEDPDEIEQPEGVEDGKAHRQKTKRPKQAQLSDAERQAAREEKERRRLARLERREKSLNDLVAGTKRESSASDDEPVAKKVRATESVQLVGEKVEAMGVDEHCEVGEGNTTEAQAPRKVAGWRVKRN